jgi:hypothetical protein
LANVFPNKEYKTKIFLFLTFIQNFTPEKRPIHIYKALLGFFFCIFSSLICLKKLVFSKGDLLQWKVPARLYWDLWTSGRY